MIEILLDVIFHVIVKWVEVILHAKVMTFIPMKKMV